MDLSETLVFHRNQLCGQSLGQLLSQALSQEILVFLSLLKPPPQGVFHIPCLWTALRWQDALRKYSQKAPSILRRQKPFPLLPRCGHGKEDDQRLFPVPLWFAAQ